MWMWNIYSKWQNINICTKCCIEVYNLVLNSVSTLELETLPRNTISLYLPHFTEWRHIPRALTCHAIYSAITFKAPIMYIALDISVTSL